MPVSDKPRQRAIVIGGSIGGLLAAHQLLAIGWEVQVFERSADDLADRGAGISTHQAIFDAASRAGLVFDTSSRTVPRAYVCLAQDGRVVEQKPAWRTMTNWSRLYRPLRDGLPPAKYLDNRVLTGVENSADGVTAIFADGRRIDADLLVAADGIRSTVRAQIFGGAAPAYAGYVAWRALVPQSDLPAATWQALEDVYVFAAPDGELLVSYAVPTRVEDQHRGQHSYNIVWYRPANEVELRDLCTDDQGRQHEGSIPPHRIRRTVVDTMKADARALLAKPLADVITCCADPFLQPIYDLASPRVTEGRVALLGDAAFIARPHVGAGVTKAALDAMGLADAIVAEQGRLKPALRRYNDERTRFGRWCVERGQQMGARIKRRAPGGAAPTAAELDQNCRLYLDDYIRVALDIEALTGGAGEGGAG